MRLVRVLAPARPPESPSDPAAALGRTLDRAVRGLMILAVVAGLALLVTAQWALAAATLGLAGAVRALIAVGTLWNGLRTGRGAPGTLPAEAFRTQAASLVTLQGVVLTLVLTLGGAHPSAAVKAGGAALVVGVLLGLLLAQLVALGTEGRGQVVLATFLFTFTLCACAYGLLCLGASLVLER